MTNLSIILISIGIIVFLIGDYFDKKRIRERMDNIQEQVDLLSRIKKMHEEQMGILISLSERKVKHA